MNELLENGSATLTELISDTVGELIENAVVNKRKQTYARYAKIRDSLGLRDAAVAKKSNLGRSTFSDWKAGRSEPKLDKLEKISDALGVDLTALMDKDEDDYSVENQSETAIGRKIPIYGKVAAGQPVEAIDEVLGWEVVSNDARGELFCLTIKGDSMSPYLFPEDIVIVRSQKDAENGDIVIVQINGDQAACKKLMKHQSGISLISLNPIYEPMNFTNEQIENYPVIIMGVVVECRRKVKRL